MKRKFYSIRNTDFMMMQTSTHIMLENLTEQSLPIQFIYYNIVCDKLSYMIAFAWVRW